jgi:hypothetical protein
MGDPAAADASYREAIAIAQRQSARLWELCAATSREAKVLLDELSRTPAGRGRHRPRR